MLERLLSSTRSYAERMESGCRSCTMSPDSSETSVVEPALKTWRQACDILNAPTTEESYKVVQQYSASNDTWHSLTNCISHQATVWNQLLAAGMDPVMQPAAFKLAIVLRHTPCDVSLRILSDVLQNHPQAQDLTSYVIALLTDDEAEGERFELENGAATSAPMRDLQMYGDLELAVHAAPTVAYDSHSELVRAEYIKLTEKSYMELRIKVLRQFLKVPKMYHTPEFYHLECAARENIDREVSMLRGEVKKK